MHTSTMPTIYPPKVSIMRTLEPNFSRITPETMEISAPKNERKLILVADWVALMPQDCQNAVAKVIKPA